MRWHWDLHVRAFIRETLVRVSLKCTKFHPRKGSEGNKLFPTFIPEKQESQPLPLGVEQLGYCTALGNLSALPGCKLLLLILDCQGQFKQTIAPTLQLLWSIWDFGCEICGMNGVTILSPKRCDGRIEWIPMGWIMTEFGSGWSSNIFLLFLLCYLRQSLARCHRPQRYDPLASGFMCWDYRCISWHSSLDINLSSAYCLAARDGGWTSTKTKTVPTVIELTLPWDKTDQEETNMENVRQWFMQQEKWK